jgi:hypothetical protein
VRVESAGFVRRGGAAGPIRGRRRQLVRSTARCARIPLAVGGGVRFASLADGAPCGLATDGIAWRRGGAYIEAWGAGLVDHPGMKRGPLPVARQ